MHQKTAPAHDSWEDLTRREHQACDVKGQWNRNGLFGSAFFAIGFLHSRQGAKNAKKSIFVFLQPYHFGLSSPTRRDGNPSVPLACLVSWREHRDTPPVFTRFPPVTRKAIRGKENNTLLGKRGSMEAGPCIDPLNLSSTLTCTLYVGGPRQLRDRRHVPGIGAHQHDIRRLRSRDQST